MLSTTKTYTFPLKTRLEKTITIENCSNNHLNPLHSPQIFGQLIAVWDKATTDCSLGQNVKFICQSPGDLN